MAIDVACPNCGESDDLAGRPGADVPSRDVPSADVPSADVPDADVIAMACGSCGFSWQRSLNPRCDRCGGSDLQTVPLAIIEKGRGTQLSVVGVRPVDLCSSCDGERLRHYHDHRPNPLMPERLPTIPADDGVADIG